MSKLGCANFAIYFQEGRAADPRLSIADLLEAINHLEEKRQDSALQHPAKKSESSTKTDVSILANPIVKKTQEGIFAHGVAGSSNDWFNTQGNLFAKKPVQFAGHPNLKVDKYH